MFQRTNTREVIMADEESIKRLEARLTRLEAALANQAGGAGGFTPPGGVIADPAPYPTGGWGGWGGWGHTRWPHPVVDPAAWPSTVSDPAPWGGGWGGWGGYARPTVATTFGRIGQVGDPPPIDVSRFSISQLESALHSINAEKARLNSMETMIRQQLDRVKQQQG